ncbi:capsule biosynthesis protein [Bibersteinia trehalosi]|uniref:capsule biosynthesis protein n=1 Tax=Bibersteinia trehalosi TaxID=47735 RepID=UPI002D77092C|nr:capsule biosynthesis protein [Bibersteinia trehalosi]
MINHYLDDLVTSSKRILLLQGPIGAFFYEFSKWLQAQQRTVFKINFNAGDERFYPAGSHTIAYRNTLGEFADFLYEFCQCEQIDSLVCFGDNRKYHKIAKQVADQLGLAFWVFEEGYFRPDYITLEKSGVNAFSPIPRTADYFLAIEPELTEIEKPERVSKGFFPMAKRAIQYYFSGYFCRWKYPHYQHHRFLNVGYYIKLWGISLVKRFCYAIHDRNFAKRVEAGEFGEFFIVPLQVYDDSQVVVHSDYPSVEAFLSAVLESFSRFAPEHCNLIIKHHPMDRGFLDYAEIIAQFEQRYPNLQGRVFYIHDVPMPVFLRHGKGMVTLNSTSGISGLLHSMPVMTLGRANYDFVGLTHQGDLDSFWQNPQAPDRKVFENYHRFHLNRTQINGNFYSRTILRFPYNQAVATQSYEKN